MAVETFVYRLRDGAGQLLYVGIATHVESRMQAHRRGQTWWDDVAEIDRSSFPSRRAALAEEERAIRDEHPLHNKYLSPTYERPRVDPVFGTCRQCGSEQRVSATGFIARHYRRNGKWCGGVGREPRGSA